jgi:hypothetical protein
VAGLEATEAAFAAQARVFESVLLEPDAEAAAEWKINVDYFAN